MKFVEFCSHVFGKKEDCSVGTLSFKNGSNKVDIEFCGAFGATELYVFEQYCTVGLFTNNQDGTLEYANSHKDYAFYRAVLAAFTNAEVNPETGDEVESVSLFLADEGVCKSIDRMLEKLRRGIVKRLHEIQDAAIDDMLKSKHVAFAVAIVRDICDLKVEADKINHYLDSLGNLVESMNANNIDFKEVLDVSKRLAGKSVESIAKSIIDINAKRERNNKEHNGGE